MNLSRDKALKRRLGEKDDGRVSRGRCGLLGLNGS